MSGLDRTRYAPEMACAPGGGLNDMVRAAGMPVRVIRHFVQPVAPVSDLRALFELVGVIRSGGYDIVHTHNSKAGFIGRLAAFIAGTPIVVHTVHGFAFHESESAPRRVLFCALERLAANWCHHMIFISRPLVEWARREGVLRPGMAHSVIYSGIRLNLFRPVSRRRRRELRREMGLAPDAPVIGMVSKLWPGKGHDVLLRAFAALRQRMPRARLLIVGEGAERANLERLARSLGLGGAVVFAGFMADVRPAIGACDATVLPSLFEGMGRVLLESMAMGVPVIASEVGGIPDLVRHRENGLLVPPGNVRELALAMHHLLHDTQQARELGRAGRRTVTECYGADAMVGAIDGVYRGLLAARRAHD
nr:glycosyltransferase family 4 protein [Desulfobaculum xiamenense]